MIIEQTKSGIQYIEENGVIVSKKCTKCGEFKSISDFHNSKVSFVGKKNMCKNCSCSYSRIKKAEKAELKRKEAKRGFAVTWKGNDEDFRLIKPYGNIKTEHIMKADSEEVVAKKCGSCKEMLSLDSYDKHGNGFDGNNPLCKECSKARFKKYREENPEKEYERHRKYFEQNRERIYAYRKKWYKPYRLKNGDRLRKLERKLSVKYREKRKVYHAKWRKENPEYIFEYHKKYYAENAERKLEYQKQHYQENKEIYYHNARLRRTRELSLPSTLTAEQDVLLLQLQSGKCILSGASENLEFEHFIPISWGAGGTTFENCYYLEGTLNGSKLATNPFKWIRSQNEEYQKNFHEKLVPMLAERNGLSVEEFNSYVNECEKKYKEKKEVSV